MKANVFYKPDSIILGMAVNASLVQVMKYLVLSQVVPLALNLPHPHQNRIQAYPANKILIPVPLVQNPTLIPIPAMKITLIPILKQN